MPIFKMRTAQNLITTKIVASSLVATSALAIVLASGAAQAALFDRGGGLIYDNVLNVTWLQDANYGAGSSYDDSYPTAGEFTDGRMSRTNALAWADNLSYYDSVRNVTYTDWRLPKTAPVNGISFNYAYSEDGSSDYGYLIGAPETLYAGSTGSELAYMFYTNLKNPGAFYFYKGHVIPSWCSSAPTCVVNTGPFRNLQYTGNSNLGVSPYWSGTDYLPDPQGGWVFGMQRGNQKSYLYGGGYESYNYAWAVRDGDVAAIPEPETYALFLAGLGLMWLRTRAP